MKKTRAVVAAAIVAVLSGCAPRSTPPQSGADASVSVVDQQTGLASYYADSFHGRTTASGVTFDNRAPVAAHPSLPFGSLVRITNIANGRSVDVRVIDRGPAASARARGVIVDVSRAVAEQLDFVLAGRTQVRLEVLQRGRPR